MLGLGGAYYKLTGWGGVLGIYTHFSSHILGVLLPQHPHTVLHETSGTCLCFPTSNSEGRVLTATWWGLHSGA